MKSLKVSTVEFSNGNSYKLIQGAIKLNKKNYPFTILADSITVMENTFPLVDLDSCKYNCTLRYSATKFIEIEWTRKGNRLFLRKRLPQRVDMSN